MSRHNANYALPSEERPAAYAYALPSWEIPPAYAPAPIVPAPPGDLPPGLELELARLGFVLLEGSRAFLAIAEARGHGRIALRHAAASLSHILAADPKALAGHIERTIARMTIAGEPQ